MPLQHLSTQTPSRCEKSPTGGVSLFLASGGPRRVSGLSKTAQDEKSVPGSGSRPLGVDARKKFGRRGF
eukprot:4806675-Pyramimonas_sp.AAC.1